MQKIKYSIINTVIAQDISGTAIDLLLYISQYQNALGSVRGINYKHVCLALDISYQSFYNAKDELEALGIIHVDWYNQKDWNISIIGNEFMGYADFKAGYLNTNILFLHTKEFRALPAGAKKLILKLLICRTKDQTFKVSMKKMIEWCGASASTLKKYIAYLEQYFHISMNTNNVYSFKLKRLAAYKCKDTEKETYYRHMLHTHCKQFKVCYTLKDLQDTLQLFSQYCNNIREVIASILHITLKKRMLEPRLIHYHIIRAINA